MQHNAAFHQGLHCLLRLEQQLGTEIHHKDTSTSIVYLYHFLKYKMGNPIFIVSKSM